MDQAGVNIDQSYPKAVPKMPEDVQLTTDLQDRRARAVEAADIHRHELQVAERVITACDAGLAQLDTDTPEGPPYPRNQV